jgi:hypothetical protein
LGEWRDPLWLVRFRLAALVLFIMAILPSIARSEIRHSVFGLNPRTTYDVYVQGCAVVLGAHPSPEGDITFVASSAGPVRVVPNDVPGLACAPSASLPGLGVSQPMPNPAEGSFEMRIGADHAGEIRLSLIEAATGRSRYTRNLAIPRGETLVRIAIPARLASGVYLVRVERGKDAVVRKLLLLHGGPGMPKR